MHIIFKIIYLEIIVLLRLFASLPYLLKNMKIINRFYRTKRRSKISSKLHQNLQKFWTKMNEFCLFIFANLVQRKFRWKHYLKCICLLFHDENVNDDFHDENEYILIIFSFTNIVSIVLHWFIMNSIFNYFPVHIFILEWIL